MWDTITLMWCKYNDNQESHCWFSLRRSPQIGRFSIENTERFLCKLVITIYSSTVQHPSPPPTPHKKKYDPFAPNTLEQTPQSKGELWVSVVSLRSDQWSLSDCKSLCDIALYWTIFIRDPTVPHLINEHIMAIVLSYGNIDICRHWFC